MIHMTPLVPTDWSVAIECRSQCRGRPGGAKRTREVVPRCTSWVRKTRWLATARTTHTHTHTHTHTYTPKVTVENSARVSAAPGQEVRIWGTNIGTSTKPARESDPRVFERAGCLIRSQRSRSCSNSYVRW